MNNRYEGIDGETLACEYMREHNIVVLERNYTCPQGEIDVVAKDGDYLVFCEVKSRKSARMGYPIEAVTPQKITQIVHTANWYLKSKRKMNADVRFDVAAVNLVSGEVEYIQNAFTAADAGKRNHW